MPSVVDVDSLRFIFGDDWRVIKLDEHAFFKQRLMPLQVTRAVDIVGLYRGRSLYLIEAKNYLSRPILLSNAEKDIAGDSLELKVARKAKDSVACIMGASRTTVDEWWASCADAVRARHLLLKVVLWLEFEPKRTPRGPRLAQRRVELIKQEALVRERSLRNRLAWLTKEVVVVNRAIHAGALPDTKVELI
jgi:hypothetical protein